MKLKTISFEKGRESFLTTMAISDLQKLAKRIITEDLRDINVIHGDETQGNAVSTFLYLEGVNKNNLRTTFKVGNEVVEIEGSEPTVVESESQE